MFSLIRSSYYWNMCYVYRRKHAWCCIDVSVEFDYTMEFRIRHVAIRHIFIRMDNEKHRNWTWQKRYPIFFGLTSICISMKLCFLLNDDKYDESFNWYVPISNTSKAKSSNKNATKIDGRREVGKVGLPTDQIKLQHEGKDFNKINEKAYLPFETNNIGLSKQKGQRWSSQ